jgi:membrane-bound metal-dependent hydrolase YbcI (DUF457 family)
MLGYSHAMSGGVAWLALAPLLQDLVGREFTTYELVAGTIATAGAALIPDLDHPQATIAHTFGPISKFASKITALLSGGHRQGTHSILFAVGFGFLCYFVGLGSESSGSNLPAMILMFLLASFAFRGLNIVPPKTSGSLKGFIVLVEAAAITWGLQLLIESSETAQSGWWWLGIAGGLGAFVHLIGDALTPEGVPFFYPIRMRISVPIISRTGNIMEKGIISPLLTLALIYLAWMTFAIGF